MYNTIITPFPQTSSDDFPNNIFEWEDIKLCIDGLLNQTSYCQKCRFNVHPPSSHVLVKLYSLVSENSTHQAAEELNEILRRKNQDLKKNDLIKYKDQRRTRRFIPYQTNVDKTLLGMVKIYKNNRKGHHHPCFDFGFFLLFNSSCFSLSYFSSRFYEY